MSCLWELSDQRISYTTCAEIQMGSTQQYETPCERIAPCTSSLESVPGIREERRHEP